MPHFIKGKPDHPSNPPKKPESINTSLQNGFLSLGYGIQLFPLLVKKKTRITSYNVCYTKLLREVAQLMRDAEAVAQMTAARDPHDQRPPSERRLVELPGDRLSHRAVPGRL